MRHRKQGSAMVWAIILFTIASILITSIIFIVAQDTTEVVIQNNTLSAHFISLSGIDIGYAALMAPKGAGKYIDAFIPSKADVTYSRDIMDASKKIGTVSITIGNVTLDGKRWIQVTSIGTLEGTSAQVTNFLRIDPDNHSNIVQEKK